MPSLELNFTIEGEKQLLRRLQGVSENLKDWRPEFKKVGSGLLKTFKDNFQNQGRTLGMPWQRLKPSTLKEKIRLGYSGAGILVRTGKMKRSFQSKPGHKQVVISNPTSYFPYHQSNKSRNKLPRRVMMRIDNIRAQEIVKVFQSAVQEILQGDKGVR